MTDIEGCGDDGSGGDLGGLTRHELEGLCRRLVSVVEDQAARVEALEDRIESLEADNERFRREAGRDSTNSGMPPSTDPRSARVKRAQRCKVSKPGSTEKYRTFARFVTGLPRERPPDLG